MLIPFKYDQISITLHGAIRIWERDIPDPRMVAIYQSTTAVERQVRDQAVALGLCSSLVVEHTCGPHTRAAFHCNGQSTYYYVLAKYEYGIYALKTCWELYDFTYPPPGEDILEFTGWYYNLLERKCLITYGIVPEVEYAGSGERWMCRLTCPDGTTAIGDAHDKVSSRDHAAYLYLRHLLD